LAEKFGVTEKTVSQWVSEIRARYRQSRDALIYKLYLLGWTQEEIGKIFGITHQAVSKIATNFGNLKTVAKSDFYEKRKPIEEICQYHQIDEPTYHFLRREDSKIEFPWEKLQVC